MNAKDAKKFLDDLIETGVTTKEKYLVAVPALFEMDKAIQNAKDWVAKLVQARDKVSEMAAEYAIEHTKALDEAITEDKDGIESATVAIDGKVYRLTVSDGAPKRISGSNMTQAFLARLPDGWTSSKLSLSTSALKDCSAEELAAHDLCRPKKRVWSVASKVAE